jgi:sugar O-acyltransferase (sialic acid O-acetyltransferase NeuD family)
MRDKIFVFGASGHAKVVIDIIERQGFYAIEFLVDDNRELHGREFFGYPVLGGKEELLRHRDRLSSGIVAIGSNRARMAVAAWLTANGFSLATAVHPSALLARGVTLGAGTVVMAGVAVNADARIGENVIVNTRASIDHDCRVGNGVHIAPGATLCGSVTLGDNTFVCAGATVIPNLSIGANAVIGAGAAVIRDVPDGATVAGIPAKSLK